MDNLVELERNSAFAAKLDSVKSLLKGKKVVVALSGGRDSALLSYLSSHYAKKTRAIFIQSELAPSIEATQAETFCNEYSIPFEIIHLSTLSIQMIKQNGALRCYYCKQLILQNLEEIAENAGFTLVVDGTNYSDLLLIRAGLQALRESRVESPFALAQITKKDIIEISRHLGLISQNYTSQACLASRIPFDIPITEDLLESIDQSENFLRSFLPEIHTPIRVRVQQMLPTKQYLARIEGGPELFVLLEQAEIRAKISHHLKDLGFTYITIDLEGFQSGSMHRML
ncbi:MAG: ATP-dependent sacrificial sulfur transferase LarE, partial [Promethearchaeota archaeon]